MVYSNRLVAHSNQQLYQPQAPVPLNQRPKSAAVVAPVVVEQLVHYLLAVEIVVVVEVRIDLVVVVEQSNWTFVEEEQTDRSMVVGG